MASSGAKTKSKKKSARKRASRPKSPGHKVLTRPRSTRKQPARPPKKALPNLRPDESRPSKRGKWRRPEPEWDSESELGFGSSALMALRKKPAPKSRVSREATRSKSVARKSVASKTSRAVTRAKSKSGAKGRVGNSSRGPSRALTPPKRKKVASKRK
ncbi:MAG: hypothetical protein EBZ77_11775 [Chitinophagia bacterium]|nr:hypothetical protein [Chitinophagia bacterium]